MLIKSINVALIGNPNVGKTSLFNLLTGLNQQVGNYPGITVEKKVGFCKLYQDWKANIMDFPGTYSLNASSLDERVAIDILLNKKEEYYPDVVSVITDVENLKRNLLLFTQIKDLGVPTILVINMIDRMELNGIMLDIPILEKELKTKIALVSSRKNTGIDELKNLIIQYKSLSLEPCLDVAELDHDYFTKLHEKFPNQPLYKSWLNVTQDEDMSNLETTPTQDNISTTSYLKKLQQKETIKRYQLINNALKKGLTVDVTSAKSFRYKLDRILTHSVGGYLIFFCILFMIFQSIFEWSAIPMNFIDNFFVNLSTYTKSAMPPGVLTHLISDGIIPGISGVLIFIPQIAFLFLFISILEESGYMSRVVFLMDKIMRKFGLSGKSIVPLIAGTACAIPAIMSTRNIENHKERIIAILVTPFVTCSARLPVYTLIIAVIIPKIHLFGFLSLQGLVLMALYLIGFGMAILSAYILNKIIKTKERTFFVIEMPNYKLPLLKNIVITVVEKTKSFVFQAGKIILAISILLWFSASYGPGKQFDEAEKIIAQKHQSKPLSESDFNNAVASQKLENSYIGLMGKSIEPIITPLGYDWKIGIAIISSFAAREVFIGTLATIYSVGGTDNEATIKERIASEKNTETGKNTFNLASGISLLLYYAFAMQCISTIAIARKELNSWRLAMLQLFFMSALAYILALIAFQILK